MKIDSIYELIKDSLVEGKLPEGFCLPRTQEDDIVFADGALDGIYLYHAQPTEISDEDYSLLVEAIDMASNHDFEKANELFEKISINNRAITICDVLQGYIFNNSETILVDNMLEFAMKQIRFSNNIECIKYGLIILETICTNNEELKEIVRTLSLSDEFTLYCVFIMNTWVNGNDEIFETAKKVCGWGRIHALRYLRVLMPREKEIREWMLKEGINNYVLPSYSALTVWKEANIGSILFVDPTREEFTYIGRIIDALLDESALLGISTLDKSKEILLKYLQKAREFKLENEDYEIIKHIMQYAKEISESDIVSQANDILNNL